MTRVSLPPITRRLLVLLLDPDQRERALIDLEDRYLSDRAVLGEATARKRCAREARSVLVWAMVDRLRQMREPPRQAFSIQTRKRSMRLDFLYDLRLTVRGLVRRPGFSLLAVGILALGLGANISILTLANGLFFEPPPGVEEPGQLVRLLRNTSVGYGSTLPHPDYVDYRSQSRTLAGLAAWSGPLAATARMGSRSLPIRVGLVSDNYFDLLGLVPVDGRFFRPEENATPNTHAVAVISWGFWQSQFSGVDAIGSSMVINGRSFSIVGVAPRSFRGLMPSETARDVYLPIMMRAAVAPVFDEAWRIRLADSRDNWLTVVGRRLEGRSTAEVQTELSLLASRIYPAGGVETPEGVAVTDQYRWYPRTYDSLAGLTRVLFLAVTGLLGVAVANVAILLLARVSSRRREIGIRTALGADRGRVTRTILTEGILLTTVGGMLGVALATVIVRLTASLLPVQIDIPPAPRPQVLLVALGISFGAALLVGLIPALRATRFDALRMIQGRSTGLEGGRLRDGLVVIQLALSLILTSGAVLFTRSLIRARAVDVGFDTRNVLLASVDLPARTYDSESGKRFVRDALERIGGLPGVRLVATSATVPFQDEWSTTLEPWPGATFAGNQTSADVGLNVVTPEYFNAMRIPIVRGRGIDPTDGPESQPAVVLSETMAQTVFPDQDPLGKTIPLRGPDGPGFLVVGIARDAKYYSFAETPRLMAYGSAWQLYRSRITLVVQTATDPNSLAVPVQDAVHEIDPDLPFRLVTSLSTLYESQIASYRASAQVVGLAGLIALLLAGAGLYGVMAYRVALKTREIGVRIALGATQHLVARETMTRGLRLAILGIVLGIGGAVLLGNVVQGLLFGVPAQDPITLIGGPVILLAAAIVAMLVPARRAMRVDPMEAIREE